MIVIAVTLLLAGCSKPTPEASMPAGGLSLDSKVPESASNQDRSLALPVSYVEDREQLVLKKVDEMKGKLKLGLTREEVQAILGAKLEQADDNADLENGSDSYSKYTFFNSSGYDRQDIPDHVIDEDGLKTNKIGAALFIGWKNQKLHLYSIAYIHPKDKQIHLLLLHPDGKLTDEPI
ncbi:hypothetical protein WBG83_00755 [Paenibacillus sp. y28]